MAYRIEKHSGDAIYVYEAISYWDVELQQPRQKRRYLGKKDAKTGTIIPPHHGKGVRRAKDYGNLYLLQQVADRTGLPRLLQQVFGEDAVTLLALAVFEVAEAAPLYLFSSWVETTFLEAVKPLSSSELTTFTQRLGRMDEARDAFFRTWIAHNHPIRSMVFDITSLSSYSTLLNAVEWGYNRDHEPLPQVNLGMVYAEELQVPLYYQVYPGSIRDVSTLANLVRYCDAFALTPDLFVMDRGLYSADNLAALAQQSLKFLLPLPRGVGLFAELLAQQYHALTALPNSFLFQGELLGHVQTTIPFHRQPLYAHIYCDPSRHYAQAQRFLTPLWQAEATLAGQTFPSAQQARHAITKNAPGADAFFRFPVTGDHVTIVRDAHALTQHVAPMGITIFVTNQASLSRGPILQVYRQKDGVEKAFEILKHELDGRRLRGHSPDAITGRLFLKFLSLIVYSALTKTMREQHVFRELSVRELLFELKKIRIVELYDGSHVLTEISKRQRRIFKAFNIEPPLL